MPKKLFGINSRPTTSPHHTIMQQVLCGSWTRITRTKIQEKIFKGLDEVKKKKTYHGASSSHTCNGTNSAHWDRASLGGAPALGHTDIHWPGTHI